MDSIIILCKTLLKGGAEKQALTLSKLLAEKGKKIFLINWSGDKIDKENLDFIQKNYIRYIGLTRNPIIKMIEFQRIIKRERIGIILSYLTLPNFVAGISNLLNRKLLTIGGIRTEKLPYYKFFFEKIVHNWLNNATVFNNYSAKGKFEAKGFNPEKIHVIHNAISVPILNRKEKTGNELKIISVSRFVKSKDFRTALNSISRLKEKNRSKKFKYYIVGYGPMESAIRSIINDLNLNDEVEILINPSNIPDILHTCDIYLSTSLYEGLSNSIMEAMVAGLPVIATDVGDNKYLIKDTYNGFLVPCRDVNSIFEKLEYLTNFDLIRRDFGNNSYNVVKKEFSQEKLTENYLKLFSLLTLQKNG